MPNVTLSIGGRDYAVACAEGEQPHVTMLGAMIDAQITQMPGGQSMAESRSLLFAALLLADQLHDARKRLDAAPPAPAAPDIAPADLARIAERMEMLAATLSGKT